MVGELRWILLGLSVVLLTGIWWWGARRSRQAPGNAELRETTVPSPRAKEGESRDWGVSPFEPLSIRTAGFEEVPLFDRPMTATPPPVASTPSMDSAGRDVAPPRDAQTVLARAIVTATQSTPLATVMEPPAAVAVERASGISTAAAVEQTDPHAAVGPGQPPPTMASETVASPARASNSGQAQRIVTLRVCADGDVRWPGGDLLAVLEAHGLAYGRYKVFHRKHTDGRTLFCAASLVEPGTFDAATMPEEEFRGITLFAVLPGPADSLETLETMVAVATELADNLHGIVQDSKGAPFTPLRAEALREDVSRFQASLSQP